MLGGDGNDTIIFGSSGDESVDGGAGNDTITGSTFVSTNDTIIGGEGADTLTLTIATVGTTRPASLVTVETLNLSFTAAGTFDARNVTDVTSFKVSDMDTANVNVTQLNSAITAISFTEETDATTDSVFDYKAASATDVTVSLAGVAANVDIGDITVSTNTGAVTISSGGFAANAIDALVANTASTLTLAATTKGLTQTGAASATAATTINLNAVVGDLTVAVGSTLTATAATDINLNATGGSVTLATIESDADVLTVDVTASTDETYDVAITLLDVDHVRTINLTASGAADITVSDIEMLGVDNDGTTNITTSLVISAGHADSVVTISALVPAANAVLDSVTISGAGDVNIGTGTALGANIDITSLDASLLTGSLTLTATSINAAMIVTLGNAGTGETNTIITGTAADNISGGSGNDSISTGNGVNFATGGGGNDTLTGGTGIDELDGGAGIDSITGAEGADSITGGSGVDTIVFTDGTDDAAYTGGADVLTDFTSGTDLLHLDLSAFSLNDAAAALAAGSYYEGAAGALTAGTAYMVIVLTGASYANAAAAEDAVVAVSTSNTEAFVIYHDNVTGVATMFYDDDLGVDGALTAASIAATFTNITTLVGVGTGFAVADFVIVA